MPSGWSASERYQKSGPLDSNLAEGDPLYKLKQAFPVTFQTQDLLTLLLFNMSASECLTSYLEILNLT